MGCGASKFNAPVAQGLTPRPDDQQDDRARASSATVTSNIEDEHNSAKRAVAVAPQSPAPNSPGAHTTAVPAESTAGGIAIKQSRFEEGMGKHGATVLGALAAGVGCIPDPLGISSAVSNILGLMQQRVEGAVSNTNNCRKLLEAAQWSQRCLQELQAALPPERLAAESGPALDEQVQGLERALRGACAFLSEFGEKNFLEKLIAVGGDKDDFEVHHDAITQATERLLFKLALKAASMPPPVSRYEEESEKLRAVICELGGSSDMTTALLEVKKQGLLGSAQLKAKLSAQQQFTLFLVESRLDEVLAEVRRVRLPEMLPPGLQRFWHYYFNAESVAFENFFFAVTEVIRDRVSSLVEAIQERARQLVRNTKAELKVLMPIHVPQAGATRTVPAGSNPAAGAGSDGPPAAGTDGDPEPSEAHTQVLRALLKASVDVNNNGQIHMDEYTRLYFSCCQWARIDRVPQPLEVPACISMLCRHWEPAQLLAAEQEQLRQLEAVLRPMNFATDVSNLLSRFLPDSRQWIFDAFAEWMALSQAAGDAGSGGELARRAMVLYGGPGLGKSTIAAALVCKRVFRQVDTANAANQTETVEASAVVGHYFCKHNDVVRSDPLLLMRTLAFQLAERIPELRPFLLMPPNGGIADGNGATGAFSGVLGGAGGLTPGQHQPQQQQQEKEVTPGVLLARAAWVDSLRTVEEAFQKLLLEPLIQIKDVLARRAQPLVIVIDGLDEVVLDGVSGGVAAAGGGGSGGGRQSPLLRVVCDQFKNLPKEVRFFITSRPEAHIKRDLDKAFSKPFTIWPDDPRHQDDLRRMIHNHIKDKLMSSAAAAAAAKAQRGRSGVARAAAAAQHKQQSPEVAAVRARLLVRKGIRGRLVPVGSGPMHQQRRLAAGTWPQQGGAPAATDGGGGERAAEAEADDEEDDWHASESEVAAAVDLLVEKSEGAFVYVARLLDGLHAKPRWALAELSAFPQGLYGTYEEFVSKHVGGGDSAAFQRVRRMLSVLMAAQEPLQLSALTYAWRASCNGGPLCPPPSSSSTGDGGGGGGSGGHMLYQDALDDVSGMLRMLGSLYTLRDARVMVFHKSFHDWLATRYISSAATGFGGSGDSDAATGGSQQPQQRCEDERERNPYYVDPKPGHAALATAMLPVASAKAGASLSLPLLPPEDGVFSSEDPAAGLSNEEDDDEDSEDEEEDEEDDDEAQYGGGGGGAKLGAGALSRPGFRLGSIGGRDTGDIVFLPAFRRRGMSRRKVRQAEQLRKQRAEEQAAVRAYASKFVMRHISEIAAAAAGNGGGGDGGGAAVSVRARAAVDALLRDFGFLGAVFKAGHGHTLIGQLLAVPPGCRSGWADDALRWMLVCQDSLFGAHSESAVLAAALRCPVGTQVFGLAQEQQMLQAKAAAAAAAEAAAAAAREDKERKKAARGGRGPARGAWGSQGASEGGTAAARQYWRLQRLLGGNTDWPAFILVMAGHGAHVASCCWSPNSKWLASGSWDRTVRVWDAASGACNATLKGHTADVTSVQWCPVKEGKLGKLVKVARAPLASASADGSLRVWDVATGETVKDLQGHAGPVFAVAWSPDGSKLASGGMDTTVKVWDVAEGLLKVSLKGHSERVCSVAWSPEGDMLLSGGWDGGLRMWSVAAGEDAKCIGTFKARNEEKQQPAARIFGVAWSPDGKALAAACEDAAVRLWPARAGGGVDCSSIFRGHTAPVKTVAWSPNGKLLVSAGWDSSIRLWDTRSGGSVATLDEHKGGVFSVTWSPNGRWLASASGDRLLRLWDAERAAASGERLNKQQEHTEQVRHVSWSPDGRRVASCSWRGCVQVWNVEPASGGAIAAGECSALLEGHTAVVMAVAWNPSAAQLLATGSRDHTVRVWDVAGAAAAACRHTLQGHTGIVACLAWSGDGTKLASGSGDGTLRVWSVDRTGGAPAQKTLSVLKGHGALVRAVAWAPDGQRLASGAWDCHVRVWDPANGNCLMVIQSHADRLMALAWSPDGTMLASSSGQGRDIKQSLVVFEMPATPQGSPKQLCVLQGHTDVTSHMSWSPDSSHLATSSWDGDVRLWRPRSSAASVGALEGHTGAVAAVQWSSDGRRLASGSWDHSLRVWELVDF